MTDFAQPAQVASPQPDAISFHTSTAAEVRLKRRYAAERRFKMYGVVAISIAVAMLAWLLWTILHNGAGAFVRTELRLELTLDQARLDPQGTGNPAAIDKGLYQELVQEAVYKLFPEATSRSDRKALREMVSPVAGVFVAAQVIDDPSLLGRTVELGVPTSDAINQFAKGNIDRDAPPETRPLTDKQIGWYDQLVGQERISRTFNSTFFTGADSNYPELAGIWGALVGSLYTMLVTLVLALPIGVAAAIYLEEFAPKNRFTELIEVNINNLAAVPSIVFGLLGLAVFLNFFGMPRSAPLVGGIVLALLVVSTIIIAARAALKAVPPSIREAALGMGASKLQTVMHHVLPLAMPGIMTGTIIAMAHALGETAPLLMIGMNAFVTEAPTGILDSSAALPVQVYIWADKPERGFAELTSAAIMVLLVFLVLMNGTAIWLRRKFERRW
ncbi:MAG TPA: phosphate ABC transporter permease PstA [Azospirillaceae bacterium]|nr:phosphate ABC transporter permease PstA [Azospirillaceae bacterium]